MIGRLQRGHAALLRPRLHSDEQRPLAPVSSSILRSQRATQFPNCNPLRHYTLAFKSPACAPGDRRNECMVLRPPPPRRQVEDMWHCTSRFGISRRTSHRYVVDLASHFPMHECVRTCGPCTTPCVQQDKVVFKGVLNN